MRALPALMGVALFALPALADDAALGLVLTPRTTSLEAGSSYLVRFDLAYACGEARRIELEATGPNWTAVAIQDLDTRAGRCPTYTDYVAVAVDALAPEGEAGTLRVVARDGATTTETVLEVHVRRTTPAIEVALATLPPQSLDAGDTAYFDATAVYTLAKAGSLRWDAEAPSGWRVGVPPVLPAPAAEDRRVTGTVAVTPPRDAVAGGEVLLRAVLAAADGSRVESEALVVRLEVVAPIDPDADATVDLAAAGPADASVGPGPRAPLWVLGLVFVAMVAGVYALERGDGGRKEP